MQNYSDEQLIEVYRTANGNRRRKAFDCLYLRYTDCLRSYFFFALGKDYEKAKDFAHDLFMKILESADKFDSNLQFKPWVFRIAANMCKNEYRRQEVIGKYKIHIESSATSVESLNEQEHKLREGINCLSQEQRSLIVLRFKIKLSIKEMAAIYECPEGTIKSRLFYATKALTSNYKN